MYVGRTGYGGEKRRSDDECVSMSVCVDITKRDWSCGEFEMEQSFTGFCSYNNNINEQEQSIL